MRSKYRNLINQPKKLRVYFYTSNTPKLRQAWIQFSRSGLDLHHFSITREPYEEDYSGGTYEILKSAIEQVRSRYEIRSCFFVEDTSVRIEALSRKHEDFPGVAIKDWFAKVSFEEVDAQLKQLGNNREATVYSDIALYVPGHSEPIFFEGKTVGRIAETKPDFEEDPIYPWLTPHTFNGWFIPNGAQKRLGEMGFEESIRFDFRVHSLNNLINRISEYNSVANLGLQHFSQRRRRPSEEGDVPLFRYQKSVIIFVGPTGAGKTTACDIIQQNFRARVFEASSVLRDVAAMQQVEIESSSDAKEFLDKHGWHIVAEQMVPIINEYDEDVIGISGLRTIEELATLKKYFPKAAVVYVTADVKTRLLRLIERGRSGDPKTIKDLEAKDEEQRKFGLLRVAEEVGDVDVVNNFSKEGYRDEVINICSKCMTSLGQPFSSTEDREASELVRTMLALNDFSYPATCEQISERTEAYGKKVRKYNTNRALKRVPELAKRVEGRRDLLRYQIRDSGKVFVQFLRDVHEGSVT